jgi:molecular chaperone HscB
MAADPFDSLGVPPRFGIEPAEIDQAYIARSASLHPDIAGQNAEAMREMAELNKARSVLQDPEWRADALLLRLGGPGREQHRHLPPEFLLEMMEVREQVEAAMATTDPAQRQAERERWEAWAEDQRGEAIREVGAMFAVLPPDPPAAALAAIRTRLNAWRYIERLIEQLDPDYDPARADFQKP